MRGKPTLKPSATSADIDCPPTGARKTLFGEKNLTNDLGWKTSRGSALAVPYPNITTLHMLRTLHVAVVITAMVLRAAAILQ